MFAKQVGLGSILYEAHERPLHMRFIDPLARRFLNTSRYFLDFRQSQNQALHDMKIHLLAALVIAVEIAYSNPLTPYDQPGEGSGLRNEQNGETKEDSECTYRNVCLYVSPPCLTANPPLLISVRIKAKSGRESGRNIAPMAW